MFRTSVSRLLVTLQLLTISGLVLTSGFVAVRAASVYALAGSILTGARADRSLFDALVKVRSQIPLAQTALLSQDAPHSAIDAAERNAAATMDLILAGKDLDLPPGMIADIKARWAALAEARPVLDAEMRKARAERQVKATKPWMDAVFAVVRSLEAASGFAANRVRITDPVVAEMVEVRRLAWSVRDQYGFQCSLIRPNVAESRPLGPDAERTWHSGRGAYTAAWRSLSDLLDRPGFPGGIAELVRTAHKATDEAQPRIDALVAGFDGSGRPAMDGTAFTALCNAPFDAIVRIAYGALDEAVRFAETSREEAFAEAAAAGLGLLVAFGLTVATVFGIRLRFVRPIRSLMNAVGRLRNNDFSSGVNLDLHPDEFGTMAKALDDLRRSAQEAERLEAQAEARRREDHERSTSLAALCTDFDRSSKDALGNIGQASEGLDTIAAGMRGIADNASNRAAGVSLAAEQASQGVQTVAAATEELSAAIAEVSRRVTLSADHARDAAQRAAETDATVEELNRAATKIGEVVSLISDIASQTNLLALNATIEAARAGAAGKGFAVVAGEVKHLATQTAQSTGEIQAQISNIQATTRNAVAAIRTIVEAINRISADSAAIAASIEQQGAATREISSSVQQVAVSTQEVTVTIAQLAEDSHATLDAAGKVGAAVVKVVDEQRSLGGAIERFLGEVQTKRG